MEVVVSDHVWSQEEHRNQGAWTFISPRFQNLVGLKVSMVFRSNVIKLYSANFIRLFLAPQLGWRSSHLLVTTKTKGTETAG